MPYRWPWAPVCCLICRGIHSYHRVTGSMVPANDVLSSRNEQYGASNDVLSSGNGQYDASNDVLSSRNWQYDASNDVLSSGNVLLSHNAGLGGGSYIRRVLRVRSCICDPIIAGIRGSSCQRLSKGARGILM